MWEDAALQKAELGQSGLSRGDPGLSSASTQTPLVSCVKSLRQMDLRISICNNDGTDMCEPSYSKLAKMPRLHKNYPFPGSLLD